MGRIMVLDDDPDSRALLSLWLKEQYKVIAFARVEDALQWLELGAGCDLILSDISMPEIDGMQFLHQLRHNLMLDLPVVAISAHATPLQTKAALAAGFDDYLPKPTDFHKLVETITGRLTSRVDR